MTIETKFSLGDTVWVIWSLEIRQCEVAALRAEADADKGIRIFYTINQGMSYKIYSQEAVFATKEDLQNALFGERS